jgi:hypothetical protein
MPIDRRPTPMPYRAQPAPVRGRLAGVQGRYTSGGVPMEWLAVAFTGAALLAVGMISPELLTALHIHYISSGGNGFEKLHPATIFAILAFVFLLIRNSDPIGELDRVLSGSKPLLIYFFTCAVLAFQCIVLKRPFTTVFDTFVLPALLCLLIWNVTDRQRKPLVYAIHFFVWVNIILGYYEYISKHRLVPITIGNLIVTNDWRSTALLGHPLSAAGVVAVYIMCLVLKRRPNPPSPLVLMPLVVAVCSLLVFGGRTALVAVVVVIGGVVAVNLARLVRGDSFPVATILAAACGVILLCVALPIAIDAGLLDKMLGRFASDNGSAEARVAGLHLLTLFDWKELVFGSLPARAGALQTMMGLDYGIENFWISCIVQYGFIQTALITFGLGCFVVEIFRRTAAGSRVTVLFLCIVAAGSVSFSSKNISLATYVAIIVLLLPREPQTQTMRRAVPNRPTRLAYAPAGQVR